MLDNRTILSVRDLEVVLSTPAGPLHAVRGTSIDLKAGEAIGIVGESGSGKSMTALALMRLLPRNAQVRAKAITLCGDDLGTMSDRNFAGDVAGQKVSMIFQEPMTSLNPVYSIGRQMTEAATRIGRLSGAVARERAIELLGKVGIPDPAGRLEQYPHQLSGGQRQRVMIAMALMNEPDLIIADEPTTALDVTVQAQIMDLLADLRREFGMAMILITHDLAVVASSVDKVAVMYGGEIVEQGACAEVLHQPMHPYTRALLASAPKLSDVPHRLGAIPGIVPSLIGDVDYCVFASRCAQARAVCRTSRPPLLALGGRSYACVLTPEEIEQLPPAQPDVEMPPLKAAPDTVIMEGQGIEKVYDIKRSIFARAQKLHALDDVSIDIRRGETFALVGESGSGKTTLAKILLGLNPASNGQVLLEGEPITSMDRLRRARLVQPIFQDPYSSLNPRHTIGRLIARPLEIHGIGDARSREAAVVEVMERVGLPARVMHNYPNQMSGGQRQRVAIARALVMKPAVLVCDEPTSALDVSVQAQILNLLSDLQRDLGLTYLLITHDIGVVHQVASRIAVMYLGQIVETGEAADVLSAPRHPYTQLLLSSVPELHGVRKVRHAGSAIVSNPLDLPPGCRFSARCPYVVQDCRAEDPALRPARTGPQLTRCIRDEAIIHDRS
ncbi:ABC transporter ATP-binding protein [Devosia sp. PTR5]|uniref:ABC transporter ATP-binding protein n=1 Tax=Devosia oryzisoli TaxID=2774138 RepID=A0A927IU81_9HYPH|nr:ABC transporter ATP-binding protein [Devosia oryzisoli]MBD8066588.1 ABC transporter ATP-binding protein [Devosia oryzisoli]